MTVVNGQKKKVAHSIVDGDKGASFYYLEKTDSTFKRIKIIEKDGRFEIKQKINEDESSDVLDEKGFKDLVKKDKDLAFITEYLKEAKKTGGVRERKTSKKVVKKVSKKVSKKVVRRRVF
jgi:hypothetical protein